MRLEKGFEDASIKTNPSKYYKILHNLGIEHPGIRVIYSEPIKIKLISPLKMCKKPTPIQVTCSYYNIFEQIYTEPFGNITRWLFNT